jgi:hypothetical protein
MKSILIFLVIFGILVFVHEFGHFFVGKKCGILVREFSIGMGPKLFQVMKKKTTYTIRWLPIGGYVRFAGPDDIAKIDPGATVVLQFNDNGEVVRIDNSGSQMPISGIPVQVIESDLVNRLIIRGYKNGDENENITYSVNHDATIIEKNGSELIIAPEDTQFQNAKVLKKIASNVAGPLMNIILGFIVFIGLSISGPGAPTTVINKTIDNSPAQRIGLKNGDQVKEIEHQKVSQLEDISKIIAEYKGKKVEVVVLRNNSYRKFKIKPMKVVDNGQTLYQLGFICKLDNNLFSKLAHGCKTSLRTMGLIFNALSSLIRHFSLDKLSGPVGIYSQTRKMSNLGFAYVVTFLAMISINLGIVNLLPIPGLDGGKLLLNVVELVTGKPLSPEKEELVNIIGFVFLLILIIAVTGNDIYRFFIK